MNFLKYILLIITFIFSFSFCKKPPTFEETNELDPRSESYVLPIPRLVDASLIDFNITKLQLDINNFEDFDRGPDVKFEIQRAINSEEFQTLKTIEFTNTVYDTLNFEPNELYSYRLRTLKNDKKGEFSNIISNSFSLLPPSNVSIFGTSETSLEVSWEATTSFNIEYLLKYKKSLVNSAQEIRLPSNILTYQLSELDTSSSYTIEVIASTPVFESNENEIVKVEYKKEMRKNSEYRYEPSYISAARISYTQNGERIIVGTDQGEIHLFNKDRLDAGPIKKFNTESTFIYFVESINNSTEIIAIDSDNTFYLFDNFLNLKEKRFLDLSQFEGSLRTKNGDNIIVYRAPHKRKAYFYSVENAKIIDSLSFPDLSDDVRAKFSIDGSKLVTVVGKTLELRNYPNLELLGSYTLPDLRGIYGFSYISDTNKILISGGGFETEPFFRVIEYNGSNNMSSIFFSEVNFALRYDIYSFKNGLAFLGSNGSYQAINIFDLESKEFLYNAYDSKSRYSNYFDEHPILENTFIESGSDNYIAEWTFAPNWNLIKD